MSVLWLAVLALGVSPGEASSASANANPAADQPVVSQPSATPRQGVELSKAVDESLRRWAKVTDADAPKAARELLALFGELKADQKIVRDSRDQRIARVRARLSKLALQIRKEGDAKPASVGGADKPQVMAQFGGGFGGGMNQQGFGGGGNPVPANDDNGQDLADLIQKTIAPSSWEINGGLGSIYYFRSNRSLVISQREDVHEQIVDLMEQLERANR